MNYKNLNLHMISLKFRGNKELEEEYRDSYFKSSINIIRLSNIIGLVIYASFGVLDAMLFPDFLSYIYIIRYGIVCPIILLTIILSFYPVFRKIWQYMIFLQIVAVGASIIVYTTTIPYSEIFSYYAGIVILFMYGYTFSRASFRFAAASCISVELIYVLFEISLGIQDDFIFFNNLMLFSITNFVGMVASYMFEYSYRKSFVYQKLLNDEKEKVRLANIKLEQNVTERTGELKKANENLKLEIVSRKLIEDEVFRLNQELEKRVAARTQQLQKALNELKEEIKIRRKTQDELLVTQDELEKALSLEKELNKMKSNFITTVSHEYRTPMTIIQSSTYLLDRYFQMQDENKFKDHLFKIQLAIKSMTQMLDDVLLIGKSDAQQLHLNKSRMDITSIINDVIEQTSILDNKSHIISFANSAESLMAHTDPAIFRQIVSNVLSNALKYSPENSIVEVLLNKGADNFTLEIIDQGIGIPKEETDKIFDSFYRGSNVGVLSGTGLGLTTVRRCVDLLDANITVDSEKDSGTRVILYFPLQHN